MSDGIRPGDYGEWLRAKNIDQTQAASAPFDALAPNALTTVFSGSAATGLGVVFLNPGAAAGTDIAIVSPTTTVSSGAATWTAVLVRDPAGGGAGGVSTVTANQGVSGTQAWPVAVSGEVNVGTIAAVSVSAIPSVLASISAIPSVLASVSAIPSVLASVSAIPAISAVQSGAWTANVSVSANVSQLVSVSAIPSVLASVSAIPSVLVSASALPAISVSAFVATAITAVQGSGGATAWKVRQHATQVPSKVTFSAAASGTTSLVAAPGAGSAISLLNVRMFNGDTTLHDVHILAFTQTNTGTTTVIEFPAYVAAGAGGNVGDWNVPCGFSAVNSGMAISVVGAVGTRGIVGAIQYIVGATT